MCTRLEDVSGISKLPINVKMWALMCCAMTTSTYTRPNFILDSDMNPNRNDNKIGNLGYGTE